MKKTFKVVMLPTRNNSNITKLGGKLQYYSNLVGTDGRNFHLYIISDDEIKEGDWCVNKNNRIVKYEQSYRDREICKKIIATTDRSLQCTQDRFIKGYIAQLPQLPESFIQAYIKAYNEGKPITEVDLEVEYANGGYSNTGNPPLLVIKTRSDNTVIVKESKKYSLDEVMTYAFYAAQYVSKQIAKNPKVIITKSEIEEYIRREIE